VCMEPRNQLIAGAETVQSVERNMSDAVMRGIVALPRSDTVSNVLCRKHFEPLLYFHVGEVVLVSKPVMAPHHHG